MLFDLFRFVRGLFGYGSAKRRQRELNEELKSEAQMHRALADGARHGLSQIEREMREAEREERESRR